MYSNMNTFSLPILTMYMYSKQLTPSGDLPFLSASISVSSSVTIP